MNAEIAYVFRHALLRDAAYQLQLPSERARLHGIALEVLQALAGGPPPPDIPTKKSLEALPVDPWARELAEHARLSGEETLRRLYLRRAAEHADRTFEVAEAQRLWEELAGLEEGMLKGEAMRRAGLSAGNAGRLREAARLLEAAVPVLAAHDRRREGLAHGSLASARHRLGSPAEAEQGFQRAIELLRAHGDPGTADGFVGKLGYLYKATGRPDDARRAFEQALAGLRAAGDPAAEATVVEGLAQLFMETGRAEESEALLEQALAFHRARANVPGEANALAVRAGLRHLLRRDPEADRDYERSIMLFRSTGNRNGEGFALMNRATVFHALGQPERARQALHEALALHRDTGNRQFEGATLGYLARLHHEAGRLDDAERDFRLALAIHREIRHRRFEGIHLCEMGELLVQKGRVEEARETWAGGAGILRELGDAAVLAEKFADMAAACGRAGIPPLQAGGPDFHRIAP